LIIAFTWWRIHKKLLKIFKQLVYRRCTWDGLNRFCNYGVHSHISADAERRTVGQTQSYLLQGSGDLSGEQHYQASARFIHAI
jgi:hypothetical protein